MTGNAQAGQIKVKALGLLWRGAALLASEIRDSDGSLKGVRPLGGTVEMGEATRDTLHREFLEELGQNITITGPPIVLENIFCHLGALGHEIAFLYPIRFPEGAFADKDVIQYHEDNGAVCTARWFALSELDTDGGPQLYPNGLKASLTKDT